MFKAINAFYFLITVLSILIIIYSSSLTGPFLLDDYNNIHPLRAKEYTLDSIWHSVALEGLGVHARPVSKFALVSTLALHGSGSWGFKYHNLLTHLLIALLLFWLSGRLLQNIVGYSKAWFIAALASVLWAIAPIQVSTVLYPVQRMAQLAALFTVSGLLTLSFIYEFLKEKRIKTAVFLSIFIFPLSLLLAGFSKPNGFLLLPHALLLALVLPFHKNPAILKTVIFRLLCCFIILPILLGFAYLLLNWSQFTEYTMRSFSLQDRLLTQIHVLIFYLKMILLPQLGDMTLFHDDFPITRNLNITTFFSGLFLLVMLIGSWLIRKKHPLLTFGIFWFFVAHLLESTIFDLEMVFEHRNYLASFGLMLCLAVLIGQSTLSNTIKITICFFSIIILLSMTSIRSNTWKDDELLYLVTLQTHPDSPRALTGYANILLNKNKFIEARKYLTRSKSINPNEAGVFLHLYATYCAEKKMPDQLIEQAKRLLSIHPITAYGLATINTLNIRIELEQCPNLDKTSMLSLIKIAINANNSGRNLELLYRLKAQAHALINDNKLVTESFNKAYQVKKNTAPLLELLQFQISAGLFVDAQRSITRLHDIDQYLHKDQYKINSYEELLKKELKKLKKI